MSSADETRSWSWDGAVLRAARRPDGTWSLRLPDDVVAWGPLLRS